MKNRMIIKQSGELEKYKTDKIEKSMIAAGVTVFLSKEVANELEYHEGITTKDDFKKESFPHLEAIWRLAWWLNIGSKSAEEFVIDTMVRAYNEWPFPLDIYSNKIMLFKLLTREIFGFGRQRQQLFNSEQFISENIIKEGDSNEANQNNPLSAHDQLRLLMPNGLTDDAVSGIINQLRPQSRLILLLLYIGDFSYAEIAFITDLPMISVRSVLFRMRNLIPLYVLKHNVPTIFLQKSNSQKYNRLLLPMNNN